MFTCWSQEYLDTFTSSLLGTSQKKCSAFLMHDPSFIDIGEKVAIRASINLRYTALFFSFIN